MNLIRIRLTVHILTLHTGHIKVLLTAVLLFVFVSCENMSSSQTPSEEMGLVSLNLYPEIEVKGAAAIAEGVDDFNVRYVGVGDYATSKYFRYGDMSWPMKWYFGIFRLQAESCTSNEAETMRGRLRYEGTSAPFSVINGQTAEVSVICNVANFQVKTNFDDSMYEAFEDYKLTVSSVSAPPADEEDSADDFIPQIYRTLDFTPLEQYGYYNLQQEPVLLKYVLSVRNDAADVFVPAAEGFFSAGDSSEATVVNAGDVITFNISYNGPVTITNGLKFIVNGLRNTVSNGLDLEDYEDGSVEEDK